ncbi:MAG: Gfo/Idh/MocA family protein, partial [Anaerolineales bacterium]
MAAAGGFVLAPTTAHFSIASALLAAGTDVFLEKPAASTSQETSQLSQQAQAAGRVLMVGFNRRYAPLHRLAHELWDGRPVDLALFEKHRARGFHPDLTVHYTEEMIHIIDLLRFFCGAGEALATSFHQGEQLDWAFSSA